jgi:hypothetical protein
MRKSIVLTISFIMFFALARVNAQQQETYTFCTGSSYSYLFDTAATTTSAYYQRFGTGSTSYSAHFLHDTIYQTANAKDGDGTKEGGEYSKIKKWAWTGNNTVAIVWNYSFAGHHDICPLPNGNVLAIINESINLSTYGGSSSTVNAPVIKEIKPTGATTGTVVWEWHLKNHLCQTSSSSNTYATYVTNVSQHPELFYVACSTNGGVTSDWFHMNGIDYNPILDQIVMSTHIKNEVYVIDHSTTTAMAATHAGGNSGKGGDFLYRWGSPENYGCTTDGNGISVNVIHDARWVPSTNSVWPNYISVFHNGGCSTGHGCILHQPPHSTTNPYLYDYTPGSVVGPTTAITPTTKTFTVGNMGGTQVLDNGNVLITNPGSAFYETRNSGTALQSLSVSTTQSDRLKKSDVFGPWLKTSASPSTVCANSSLTLNCVVQTAPVISSPTYTYSWTSVPAGFTSSLQNPTVTPAAEGTYTYQVSVSMSGTFNSTTITTTNTATVTVTVNACTDVDENPVEHKELNIYPNPTTGMINLNEEFTLNNNFDVMISNSIGEIVIGGKNMDKIDLSGFNNGIYYLTVKLTDGNVINKKVILIK